jgi:hypothetical protein
VIDRVISELKQILKRDFNKKMIENTAFKSFENWWDEQERKSKVRLSFLNSGLYAVIFKFVNLTLTCLLQAPVIKLWESW